MSTAPARPDTGLRRGDAVRIAKRTGLSVQHVSECAKGNRVPSARLAKEIDRLRARRAREAQQETAAAVA